MAGDDLTERVARRLSDQLEEARRQGAEAERVNGRLIKLEDHAKAVNGQIKRMADTQDAMNDRLEAIHKELSDTALVNKTLADAAKQSGDRRLTRQQKLAIWVGVMAGIVTFILYVIQISQGLGH